MKPRIAYASWKACQLSEKDLIYRELHAELTPADITVKDPEAAPRVQCLDSILIAIYLKLLKSKETVKEILVSISVNA